MAAAVLLAGKTEIEPFSQTNLSEKLTLALVIVAVVLIGTFSAILRPSLTDHEECEKRGHKVIPVTLLHSVELGIASLVVFSVSIIFFGGTAIGGLKDILSGNEIFSTESLSILWVGVVNTGVGIIWMTKLTNLIGVPLMTSISQSRPLMSEAMLWSLGQQALLLSQVIDLLCSSCLLVVSCKILSHKN